MKKNTKMYSTAIATALAASAIVTVVPAQAATVTFKDVDSSNQFYDYITELANRGIIEGYNGAFNPTLEVRRDHASKIIAKVLELDTKDVANPQFKDVPVNHPQYGEIAALKAAGIISGDGYGSFLPEKSLTRGEMAKIIANAFDLEVPAGTATPFTDVKGNMFEEYITALYVNEVTKGKGNNKFDPNGKVTRGELAAFVVRAEQVVAGEIVEKDTKVDSIDGDTIVVNGEVLALTEELKAVFNEDNAAALKNAKVELVIRYNDAQVASLAPVANNTQGEVIGIKAVELPNANTKFNAGGYDIPTVSVTANGITISNASITTFAVAKGVAVTVENSIVGTVTVEGTFVIGEKSEADEIIVKGNAKITVAKDAKIEKIVLEEGKTLKDVITNYDEVKEQLKDVKVETVKPGTTPTTPSTGGGSSNTGGGTAPSPQPETLEETIEKVLDSAANKYNNYSYAEAKVDKANNILKFEVVKSDTPLSTVKSDMAIFENTTTISSIISNVSGIGDLYDNLLSITVEGGKPYTKGELLNKENTKKIITDFVNANQGGATKIGELVGKQIDVTVTFSTGKSLTYTLKIVDEE